MPASHTSHPDPFVAQLSELCRREKTAAKWVFVPSLATGWTLGERLLHEGCDWVNLRFVTPFQLALEASAPALLAAGLNPAPENLGPCLLQSLVLKGKPSAYQPLILQPGMAEALWATLTECRMAGIQPGQLKSRELKTLLQAYEAYLEKHRLADRATVLGQPLQHCPVREGDLLLAWPYHAWAPLERQLLQRLPGQHLTAHASQLKPPRRYSPRHPVETPRVQPQLFHASRREEEIAEVFRRLEGPIDQVEIAAHPEDLPLLADRLSAAGYPATFGEGLPFALSRPGQALDGLLDWVERDMPAYHLRELFLSDLLRPRPHGFAAAGLLEAARITWGRATYHSRLTELAAYAEGKAGPDSPWRQQQADDARALAEWMGQLMRSLPAPDAQGTVDLGRWLQGLQSLEWPCASPAERQACQTLTQALEELKLLSETRWPLAQALRLIRQRLQSARWNASRPRSGCLHVSSPSRMGLSGRPHLFVLGLEERSLVPTEDCILNDDERRRLSLALSSDRVAETLFAVQERLQTLAGSVTFSYAACDRAGEQEQLPSWDFFSAARARQPDLDGHEKLLSWLGPPATRPPATLPELLPHPQRSSEAFTVFDGYVPSAANLWHAEPLSTSRLQGLATCPFQFFLEKGLRLSPEALQLPDADRWLDAATRGSVLHEVFAAYYRELRSRSWRPDRDRDQRFLRQLLDLELEKTRSLLPPPSKSIERAEREDLRNEVDRFLILELQRPERVPIGCEIPFGMEPESAEPLAHPDPVLLDLGEGRTLSVRGKIDRLDQLPQGYGVVDYKTGRQLHARRGAIFDRGRLLQHSLYAVVAEQMLREPVRESIYYFPGGGAVREWVADGPPDRPSLVRVLNLVTEPLRTGAFVHTHETSKDCQYCDFRGACRAHDDGTTRTKLQDPLLASRRQLLEEA